MTEPTKPGTIPGPRDPLDEPVKSKEKAELFPDAPVGRPSEFKEKADSLETEHIRIRDKSDNQRDRDHERVRDRAESEGRVSFRIDGNDTNLTVFSCNACKALLLKTGVPDHIDWHERLQRGKA